MIVSINQPAYLAWPGYFDRIIKSDVHIVLDHVQFEKNSMVNRNKIVVPGGWIWLTVPVLTKGKFGDLSIRELEIDTTQRWCKKHLQAIKMNYSKAPYFKDYIDFFEDIYNREWTHLAPLIDETNKYFFELLDIKTKILYSSDMDPQETKNDLVVELCKKVEAKTYISGPLGRDYVVPKTFKDAGIELLYQDYRYPSYKRVNEIDRVSMSFVDLLFNHGPCSRAILENGMEFLNKA